MIPGRGSEFLAPLDVRKIPGVGKVTEQNLHTSASSKVGDLARLENLSRRALRQMGPGAGRQVARRRCRRLVRFRNRRGRRSKIHQPRTHLQRRHRRRPQLESTLDAAIARWSAAACASTNLRRTLQLKLRYKDFTTLTRAHSLPAPTQLDTEIFEQIRTLFRKNWKKGQHSPAGRASFALQDATRSDQLLEGDRQRALEAGHGGRRPPA